MIFTLVTAVQEKLNEIVDAMKNRIEEEKRRKEKEAEEAEKVGQRKPPTGGSRNMMAAVSTGGVPGHRGHHRELPGLESNLWPGDEWAEEEEAEGGGAGRQGQADR